MQHLGTVLEAIFGRGFGRKIGGKVVRQAEEILECVVVFVACHAAEGGMSFVVTTNLGRNLNF